MMPGIVINPDGFEYRELTENDRTKRAERKAENDARKAEKQAAKDAKKAALKVEANAGLDGLRDVVALLVNYEVERDGE